jgi:hypothetical protein
MFVLMGETFAVMGEVNNRYVWVNDGLRRHIALATCV